MRCCRYILLLLLVVAAVTCRAQLSAVVFDIETRRCVPGVTVYINPSGKTMTDSYGRFAVSGDCNGITLSHGSFEPLALDKSAVRDTIWLLPKMRRLDEVVIYGKKPKPGFDIKAATQRAAAGAGLREVRVQTLISFPYSIPRRASMPRGVRKSRKCLTSIDSYRCQWFIFFHRPV